VSSSELHSSINAENKPATGEFGTTNNQRLIALGAAIREHRLGTVSVGVLVVWLIFWSANHTFLSVQNLWNMSLQMVPVGLLALGLVFVLLVGEIDLSSAALSGVVATVAARIAVNAGQPLALAILIAFFAGILFMTFEASIIVAGVPSLIVTLGGMIGLGGALLAALPSTFTVNVAGTTFSDVGNYLLPKSAGWVVCGLAILLTISTSTQKFMQSKHLKLSIRQNLYTFIQLLAILVAVISTVVVLNRGGGIPLSVLVLISLVFAANWFLRRTSFGVHLYAVGGNRDAARRAGVRTRSYIFLAFALLGVCATLSGLFSAAYSGGVSAASGPSSLVLNAIAAVVIGGVSLTGGKGSVFGALVGTVLIGSIADGVVLLGLTTQIQDYVTAGMLVLAVSVDSFSIRQLLRR